MMRSADFSSALIFGGLLRFGLRRFGEAARLVSVAFGIGTIREEAQRGLVHPRRNVIGRRPHLPITNNGPVECRLLGSTAEVDPCGDAASGWLVLYPAPDFRLVKALQD
jgi:hypothetical protein